uniref:J domain-containing protein n=1 Tax=Arcella intermedia TaxID=1963864 RepID=A0A6B2LM69_9EUKA
MRDLKKDPFDVLGVSKDSTIADIKKAYAKKAKELHPDVNSAPDAADQFSKLSASYKELLEKLDPTGIPEIPKAPPQPSQEEKEAFWRENQRKKAAELIKLADRDVLKMGLWALALLIAGTLIEQSVEYWNWEGEPKKHYGVHYEPLMKEYMEYRKKNPNWS